MSFIPTRKPASGTAPKQLVVILHGWGADGANLLDLAGLWAKDLPDAQFIAPNAPDVCEVNPHGFQWFSLMDRQPAVLYQGVCAATGALMPLLDKQLSLLNLDNTKLALVGFSQGTMLALHTALRRGPAIAGLVGFSGAFLADEAIAPDVTAKPPVCLIHGDADDVVPFAAMSHAMSTLKAHVVPVEAHRRPFLGHSIDMEGAQIAGAFLKRVLS